MRELQESHHQEIDRGSFPDHGKAYEAAYKQQKSKLSDIDRLVQKLRSDTLNATIMVDLTIAISDFIAAYNSLRPSAANTEK